MKRYLVGITVGYSTALSVDGIMLLIGFIHWFPGKGQPLWYDLSINLLVVAIMLLAGLTAGRKRGRSGIGEILAAVLLTIASAFVIFFLWSIMDEGFSLLPALTVGMMLCIPLGLNQIAGGGLVSVLGLLVLLICYQTGWRLGSPAEE